MKDCQDLALELLPKLVAIPSFSREEGNVADLLASYMSGSGIEFYRGHQNIWSKHFISDDLPTILLNSHLDTVQPVEGWTRDPFDPARADGRIYGLGSNDAGGALVSLLACFTYFLKKDQLPFNLVFAATAEEEISGEKGISSILGKLGEITLGIIGEPTGMNMAVAEKGLMVIDCKVAGKSAHAASGKGTNAIYESIEDLEWIRSHSFDKKSKWLGDVSMQVTQIKAGQQHNVVPDTCSYVIDVRTTESYTNEDIFEIIRTNLKGNAKARSFRLRPSFIGENHPLVLKGESLGLESYGSLTLSDQALVPFPTIKLGPGDPARSHTADEYIETDEIIRGVKTYIQLLDGLKI